MKKNMYSLMLSEGIVSEIDKLAYAAGTNRSNMINNILAEYVSYRTPEMRIRDIFEKLDALFSPRETLQTMLAPAANTYALRSPLAFKYNPTINYSIELYRTMGSVVGEMRAGLRTQNSTLKLYIMQFYKLWAACEARCLGSTECVIDSERFTRRLMLRPNVKVTDEQLGEAIADYVSAFDSAIKAFFYNLNNTDAAVAQVENICRRYYAAAPILI